MCAMMQKVADVFHKKNKVYEALRCKNLTNHFSMFVHYLSEMQKPWDIENWDRNPPMNSSKPLKIPMWGFR